MFLFFSISRATWLVPLIVLVILVLGGVVLLIFVWVMVSRTKQKAEKKVITNIHVSITSRLLFLIIRSLQLGFHPRQATSNTMINLT